MSSELIQAEPLPAAAQPESAELPVRAGNPLDMAPADFRAALSRRAETRRALIEWVRGALVDGVDFGAVPLKRGGYSKPSLRKPGAEKICGMLGVTATFPTLKDYETAALEGRHLDQIILRCHLLSPAGQIVADGVGARSIEQDHGDMNKALKMAVKSAHIDATLRMAGLSEIFTQDLEDMPPGALDRNDGEPQSRADTAPPRQAPAQRPPQRERVATERQVKLIRVRLDRAGIGERELCERFGIAEVEELPFGKVNPALHWIDEIGG